MRLSTGTGGRGFTLIEVVVAVGILAVVSIAIAAVFDTVGNTVTTGNRLSTLNRIAARIEQVMRRDFDGLEQGKGVLVIRNEYAQADWRNGFDQNLYGDDAVSLFDGDARPRLRRMDEIGFFASGRYTTGRAPVHPSMRARSTEARVYYGHGQRMPEDVDANGSVDRRWDTRSANDQDWRFDRPRLDDLNDIPEARLGQVSTATVINPNEFASEWLLVRHVTLLAPDTTEIQDLPADVFGIDPIDTPEGRRRVQDNSRQVGLQPAAHSIFQPITLLGRRQVEDPTIPAGANGIRATSSSVETVSDNFGLTGNARAENDGSPTFLSGLVDIATTDLSEIRSYITRGNPNPAATTPPFTPREIMDAGTIRSIDTAVVGQGLAQVRNSTATNRLRAVLPSSNTNRNLQVQQEWMLATLPSIPFDPLSAAADEPGFRMRAELSPPRLFAPVRELNGSDLEFISRYDLSGYGSNARVQEMMAAIEQADQEALVSNVFLARCSEFIVEWSYGVVDRRETVSGRANPNFGQPVWHGLRRWNDLDVNGTFDAGTDVLVADLFVDDDTDGVVNFDGEDMVDISDNGDFAVPEEIRSTGSVIGVDARLEALSLLRERASVGNTPDPRGPNAEYVFGYYDAVDTNSDGVPDTIGSWPWPSLIRVTLSIADEADRSIEQAYQVVFRVRKPEGGRL